MTVGVLLQASWGFIGIAFFIAAFLEVAILPSKAKAIKHRAIFGAAVFLMCLIQLPMRWENLQEMPKIALVVFLVGIGFGMAAGLLMIKGGIDSKPKET